MFGPLSAPPSLFRTGHGGGAPQPNLPGRQRWRRGVCSLRRNRHQRQLETDLGGPRWPAHELVQQVRAPALSAGCSPCLLRPHQVTCPLPATLAWEEAPPKMPLQAAEGASTSAPRLQVRPAVEQGGAPPQPG